MRPSWDGESWDGNLHRSFLQENAYNGLRKHAATNLLKDQPQSF